MVQTKGKFSKNCPYVSNSDFYRGAILNMAKFMLLVLVLTKFRNIKQLMMLTMLLLPNFILLMLEELTSKQMPTQWSNALYLLMGKS